MWIPATGYQQLRPGLFACALTLCGCDAIEAPGTSRRAPSPVAGIESRRLALPAHFLASKVETGRISSIAGQAHWTASQARDGAPWQAALDPIGPATRYHRALAVTPGGDRFLLVSVGPGGRHADAALLLTHAAPGHDDWRVVSQVARGVARSGSGQATLAAGAPGTLAVAVVSRSGSLGVLQSTDAGASWSSLERPAFPSVPGWRLPLAGFEAQQTPRQPHLIRLASGWALAWELHTRIPVSATSYRAYNDLLFARYRPGQGPGRGGWSTPVHLNETRQVVEHSVHPSTTTPASSGASMAGAQASQRATALQHPQLVRSASGRLAAVWRSLDRASDRLVYRLSVSDDDGATWSRSAVITPRGGGDAARASTAIAPDGRSLVHLFWRHPERRGHTTTRAVPGAVVQVTLD